MHVSFHLTSITELCTLCGHSTPADDWEAAADDWEALDAESEEPQPAPAAEVAPAADNAAAADKEAATAAAEEEEEDEEESDEEKVGGLAVQVYGSC